MLFELDNKDYNNSNNSNKNSHNKCVVCYHFDIAFSFFYDTPNTAILLIRIDKIS